METFKETRSDLDWVSFQSLEVSFTRGCWLTVLASGMIRGKTDFFRKGDLSKPLLSRAGLAIPLLPRPRLNIVVGWLHCRSLQTADLACCRECKVVVWKSVFTAAGASWLKEDRQWGLVDWQKEAGRKFHCWWLVHRLPSLLSRVTRPFYYYRPKISVTAGCWPRWGRPSLTFTSHSKTFLTETWRLIRKRRYISVFSLHWGATMPATLFNVHRRTVSVATPNNWILTVLPHLRWM